MMKFYDWKIGFRNLVKQARATIINVLGLSLGFTAVILLSIFVFREFSYDKFHKNAARIYKPEFEIIKTNDEFDFPSNLNMDEVSIFKNMVPGIEAFTFLNYSRWDWDNGAWIEYNGNKFNMPRMAFTDENFSKVFSFPVYSGDISSALKSPDKIVITKAYADKLFGNESAIGKSVLLNNKLITVGAVLDEVPSNSSIQISGLVSYLSASYFFGDPINDFSNIPFLLAREEVTTEQISKTMSKVLYITFPEEEKKKLDPVFQTNLIQITDLYYHDAGVYSPFKHGSRTVSYVLLFIGALILLLAIINYNNLLLATAIKWKKDLSIYQIFGAGVHVFKRQFFIKGISISVLAMVLTVPLIMICLPWFNQMVLYPVKAYDFLHGYSMLIVLVVFTATILLSGLLPVFLHKKSWSSNILRNNDGNSSQNGVVWKGLVTFQLFISITLCSAAIVITKQINYGLHKDLGFNSDNVVTIPSWKLEDKKEAYIHSVISNPQTISHCLSTTYISNYNFWGGEITEPGENPKDVGYNNLRVDDQFIPTLELTLIEGRNFDERMQSDRNKCIVNRAFVNYYGINDPLKATLRGDEIIGVVENFHFNSIHDEIEPLRLWYTPDNAGLSSFRFSLTSKDDLANYMHFLREQWSRLAPEIPFEYNFLDERIKTMYESDIKLAYTMITFAVLAIIIACMGIFGLLTYVMESRIKEIGIRKVNGAKIYQILQMINNDLIKWVLIASVFSIPVASMITNKWLENFAYKTNLSWWIFLLSGCIAFCIAIITVSWQSWRAATRNPVEALRYE